MSEESCQKMKEAAVGRTASEETKRILHEARKKYPLSNEARKRIGDAARGREKPEEERKKLSISLKGHPGYVFSDEQKKKIGDAIRGRKESEETRQKKSKALRGKFTGEKSPRWKGGITPRKDLIMKTPEYSKWRYSTFERDGFACVMCGCNKGGVLQAHHINPVGCNPELVYVSDNGITLCKKCHSSIRGKESDYVETFQNFLGMAPHGRNKTIMNEWVGAWVAA